jgi:hypothetical protein
VDDCVHLAGELGEVALPQAQRRRVNVALEDPHLLCHVVLEAIAALLAELGEGWRAEHILEAGGCALLAGAPDHKVEATQLWEAAQDLLDQRRPQKSRPAGEQYDLTPVSLPEHATWPPPAHRSCAPCPS